MSYQKTVFLILLVLWRTGSNKRVVHTSVASEIDRDVKLKILVKSAACMMFDQTFQTVNNKLSYDNMMKYHQ